MGIRVWLSYDLGVRGDYESLYFWLDEHKALECGDSIATFFWESGNAENIKLEIQESLQNEINFKKTDRVYLVFQKENSNYTGSFIVGKRKSNPWEGYSRESTADDE
jgi:hypothetical protein